jgi:hypothetical protein
MENSSSYTTWEKVLEYASSPLHGTLSRKLRKGVKLQFNEGKTYESAVFFLGENFIRVTESDGAENINTYYDWSRIESIRTISSGE